MRRLMIICLIVFVFLFTACSSIVITKPSDDQKYLLTPNKLIVRHQGCGTVRQNTFKAWLNKGDSDEQEITSFFSYSNGTWIANNISLPITRNMFPAYADINTQTERFTFLEECRLVTITVGYH